MSTYHAQSRAKYIELYDLFANGDYCNYMDLKADAIIANDLSSFLRIQISAQMNIDPISGQIVSKEANLIRPLSM